VAPPCSNSLCLLSYLNFSATATRQIRKKIIRSQWRLNTVDPRSVRRPTVLRRSHDTTGQQGRYYVMRGA